MPVTQVPPGLGTAITGEEWARFVLTRLGHASVVLRSGARRLTTSAPVLHVPRFTGDGSAGWYLELEEIAEGAPPGDDIEMIMRKCATLAKISSEVVSDADRAAINQVGEEMMRAVGLTVDRAIFNGAGPPRQPRRDPRADRPGDRRGRRRPRQRDRRRRPDRRRRRRSQRALPRARRTGRRGRRSATATDRPLLQPDATEAAAPQARRPERLPHPGADRGTAVVAQSDQIIVAVRDDPSVEMSDQALFTSDGHVARITTRLDCAINDKRGLAKIDLGARGAPPPSEKAEAARKR